MVRRTSVGVFLLILWTATARSGVWTYRHTATGQAAQIVTGTRERKCLLPDVSRT